MRIEPIPFLLVSAFSCLKSDVFRRVTLTVLIMEIRKDNFLTSSVELCRLLFVKAFHLTRRNSDAGKDDPNEFSV